MIPPPAQRNMAQRAGAKVVEVKETTRVTCRSSDVAKLIEQAATSIST